MVEDRVVDIILSALCNIIEGKMFLDVLICIVYHLLMAKLSIAMSSAST